MDGQQLLTGRQAAGKQESEKQRKVLAFGELDMWGPVAFLRQLVPEKASWASPAP